MAASKSTLCSTLASSVRRGKNMSASSRIYRVSSIRMLCVCSSTVVEGAVPGKLFVGQVPRSVQTEDIQSHFELCGPVKKVVLIGSERDPGKNRGYCFVHYDGTDDAEASANAKKAIKMLDGKYLGEQRLTIRLDDGRGYRKDVSDWRKERMEAEEKLRKSIENRAPVSEVENLFEQIQKPNRNAWNSLIRYHAMRKDKFKARKAFEEMRSRGIATCAQVYSSLVLAYRRGGDLPGAVACVDEMMREGLKPTEGIFSMLVGGFASRGDVRSALRWYQLYTEGGGSSPSLNPVVANNMVHAYCKAGDPGGAEALVQEVQRQGLAPSLYMFNSLLHAYASQQNLPACLQVLDRIQAAGFSPDLISFTSLLKVYTQAGRMAEAQEVLQRLEGVGLSPDLHVFTTLILGFCHLAEAQAKEHVRERARARARARQEAELRGENEGEEGWIEAEDLQEGEASGGSEGTVGSGGGGAAGRAVQLLQKAEGAGLRADRVAYESLVRALCAEGDMAGARAMAERMQRGGHPLGPRVCTILVSGWVRLGQVGQAEAELQKLIAEGWRVDVTAYNAVLHGLVQERKMEQWPVLAEQMEQQGVQADTVTFTLHMEACAMQRDVAGAFRWFQQMQEAGVPCDLLGFSSLLKACCRCGQMSRAEQVLNELRAAGFKPSTTFMNILLNGWACLGEVWEATKVLQQMKRLQVEPDVCTFTTLISACCNGEDMEKAMEVFEDMKTAGIQPNALTYSALIKGFCRVAYPEKALSVYEEMVAEGRVHPTSTVFQWLLDCLLSRAAMAPFSIDGSIQRVLQDMLQKQVSLSSKNTQKLLAYREKLRARGDDSPFTLLSTDGVLAEGWEKMTPSTVQES